MIFKHVTQLNIHQDVIVPCRKGQLDHLSQYITVKNPDFNGEFSTVQMLYGAEGNRVYLLGQGEEKDAVKIDDAFRKLSFDYKKYWKQPVQLITEGFSDAELRKVVIGLEMSAYTIGTFKSKKEQESPITFEIVNSKDVTALIEESQAIGATINRIKTLVDAPANQKTPEFLGQWAQASAHDSNYTCTVLHKKELKAQGFHAVMAVGQGSVNPPVVIVTQYMPKKGKAVDIGLVGKGITFDTGGLSIKPSTNLHYMKSDMGGAAVVLGVVELVAKLKLNVNVVGVVASAENAVDSNSYRPGDVINSYSGKTIEIIDTDAEGRLVLADGLNYIIKEFQPKQVIDLATLTGSVVQTLGYSAAGMFTNNTQMAQDLSKIGFEINERVWPLPLFSDFDSDLHSDIADLRNFSGKPIAGASTAAKFLEAFTKEHQAWMHLDIAGVSFGDSQYAKMKSASGYGVQLMVNYIKSISEN
ncbi:leucyl aminopeptidase family protein [Gelidibacter salicanalis]|uniref:Probable cytosol aminopeptidase n=1 Tax=Gelidibacter salicanalis TaxID=291193 RepID=A0A934NKL4_9FLAO|nr:leucyl aminopeptidase [Gelidibacter salicanalis]MBJ7881207.1 leucyl aminopeptidase [Gelidibacter salicanalis]